MSSIAGEEWYKDQFVQFCFSMVVTIILTVLAASLKDLRWLLVVAWPFAVLTPLGLVRALKLKSPAPWVLLGAVIVTAMLALLYIYLAPTLMAQAPANSSAASDDVTLIRTSHTFASSIRRYDTGRRQDEIRMQECYSNVDKNNPQGADSGRSFADWKYFNRKQSDDQFNAQFRAQALKLDRDLLEALAKRGYYFSNSYEDPIYSGHRMLVTSSLLTGPDPLGDEADYFDRLADQLQSEDK